MYLNKKIIALVPARGGSKGIKYKNLKKIKNKSLVEITSKFIDDLNITDYKVLNSDNKKILNLGNKLDFINIRRPKSLSGSKISDYQIINHSIKKLKKNNISADYLIYLQPTSPKRNIKHLVKTLKKVIKKKLDGAWSVTKIDKKYHPLKVLRSNKGKIQLFSKKGKKVFARQMLDDVFIRNGVFYIFSINKLEIKKTIYLRNMILSECNYSTVNIDTIADLKYARKIL